MILSSSPSLIATPIIPPQNHPSLDLLSKCKNMEEFKQIHAQMIKNGLHKTQFALSKILHFCAINTFGDLSYALSVFDTIDDDEPPDQIMWNTIIRGYSLNSSPYSAIDFYRFMLLSGVKPNSYTFPSLFKSCARIDGTNEGKQIHGHVLKLGLGCDVFIHTSMINFYAQSGELEDGRLVFDKSPLRDVVSFTALITGYTSQGRLEDARKLFDEMPVRDVVSWNSIIAGYARSQRFKEAIDIFKEMQLAKIKPDESTLVTVLSACAQSGCLTTGKRIRNLIIDRGLDSNLRLVNALIDMYSKCSELAEARSLFDSMSNKNIVSWNVMIGGYTHKHHYRESLDLFRTMLQSNYEPNEVTLLSALPACAHMGALDFGKWIHAYIDKNFPESSNTSLSTSLIDMYAKCGDIEAAKTVFESVKLKSLASWNAMISGLAMHRRAHEAIGLLEKMVNEGLEPDDITFVGVLSACSHAGLVNHGRRYFISMIQDFKISPKLQHYGCVIDLLARAGLFEEAMTMIKNMEVNPDGAIWGSLLGACTFYQNVPLGEYFAKKVLELDPGNSGAQMLLSNLYAAARRWDDVARIRTKFKDDGSKKIPGCTSIEIDGVVHEFLVSDRTHPMSKQIYEMLEETNRLLHDSGHVPDNSLVLYDISDEWKEEILCQHSERLAIAFGLISTKPGTTIRIMKNLRVCSNCHSATKLISKIFDREIIARDQNRFHHFKNGACSCLDCW
ncbi:pentatricopeptide repeat-containing protein At1g08070, chloroplastic [Cynara cardunculus var. scolymus]|uniref:Pentatricopeptide repeat-containing protein n=1 Tax=Cynara cardunculus var. scolymus TaxID=59895 RepID=A0A118K0J4_CYNCS|nr:pentatricopeptide repeat-containing protein At1g08070, chloroplastic [Cynara cardunculus var. scolymus]KVI01303.1 Pentatricopeptide repeat-containing protein [Cynara cardunculus var. scolymus]